MKKEKILKFILLLAISFAIIRIYELMQYFVGVYVFGFKLDTPPNVSQAFFDTNKLAGTYDYPMSQFYPVWRHGLPLAKRAIRSTKKLLGK